jgi:hypothetical protein
MARSKRRAKRLENRTAVGEDASSRGTDQAQPLVYDGVMYVRCQVYRCDRHGDRQADIEDAGRLPPEIARIVCCRPSIKGPALLGGSYWNLSRQVVKNVPQGGSAWTFAQLSISWTSRRPDERSGGRSVRGRRGAAPAAGLICEGGPRSTRRASGASALFPRRADRLAD